MNKKTNSPIKVNDNTFIGGEKMILFSGPCAAESENLCLDIATELKQICETLNISYVFKASFDKANRTSISSYRGIGMNKGLKILSKIKDYLKIPIVTDIHESCQAEQVADVADVLQIPAYLCRQTDLIVAASKTNKVVKIKKGQFMTPHDMKFAVEKVKNCGNDKVCLTERGTTFGYNNLVVDMRSIPIMRQFAPVIFDITHSIQQPGDLNGKSGGQKKFATYLGRAAAAVGVDGFFIETHIDPSKALSDGPNMIALENMSLFLKMLKEFWQLGKQYSNSQFNDE